MQSRRDFIFKNFQYFIFYSFLGWVAETIYCSIPAGHFVYRGFLNGPICPIYGFGALIVIHFLEPYKDDLLKLFLSGMLVTSVLEYVTSFLLEVLFNMKWWDYAGRFMNINGRVCLWNSLMFGTLAVIVMRFVHPFIVHKVDQLPVKQMEVLSSFLFVVIISDTIITTAGIINLKGKLEAIEIAVENGAIEEKLDFIAKRITNAFPKLKSNKHPRAFDRIREVLHELSLKVK